MEVCRRHVTRYAALWFHNLNFQVKKLLLWGLGLATTMVWYQSRRGGCRERRHVMHTLCNGVCNCCGSGPCYISPSLARKYLYIYIYLLLLCGLFFWPGLLSDIGMACGLFYVGYMLASAKNARACKISLCCFKLPLHVPPFCCAAASAGSSVVQALPHIWRYLLS